MKTIEKGSLVNNEKHPEHGLGRVLSVGVFATRVLFLHGGIRVFRADDPSPLKNVITPVQADADALAAKEAAMANGIVDAPVGPVKAVLSTPKAAKKKK